MRGFVVLLSVGFLVACGGGDGEPEVGSKDTSSTLQKSYVEMLQTECLKASVCDTTESVDHCLLSKDELEDYVLFSPS